MFHGTDQQFKATFRRGSRVEAKPQQTGPDIADLAAKTVIQNKDGRQEEFVYSKGAIWHQWQTSPNGGWSGWASLGAP